MKKKMLYIAAILICLSIITSGTLAYFTSQDTARNVITSGGMELQVIEQQQLVNGTLQPYPDEPIQVMPATTVSKIVSARNTQQPAWIRMTYTMTVKDAAGKVMDIPADELAKVIGIDAGGGNWTEKDGWWYFAAAVKTGGSTDPLFKEVVFSGPHMDNKYQNCTVTIDVTAQAVQQANNGTTVWEAQGWPAN